MLIALLALSAASADSIAAHELLRAARVTLGGDATVAAVRTISSWADCRGPRRSYTTEVHSSRDGRTRFVQRFPDSGPAVMGIDGDPWERDERGRFDLADGSTAAFVRGHEFHIMAIAPESRLRNLVRVADTVFASVPVAQLVGRDEFDRPMRLLYRASDARPLAIVLSNPGERGARAMVLTFDDWRRVGGVELFHSATLAHGDDQFRFAYTSLRINATVDSLLAAPRPLRAEIAARRADRAAILRMLAMERDAHLGRDAAKLIDGQPDDFATVARGGVSRPTREQGRRRMQAYFDRSNFLAWDDVAPPEILLSRDRTMAHVIVRKRVHVTSTRNSFEDDDRRTFAWSELLEKRRGEWKVTRIVSTDRDDPDSATVAARTEVLAVVQRLFDAMRTKDTAVFREVFEPGARLVGMRRRPNGEEVLQTISWERFAAMAAGDTRGQWIERAWDPEVTIRGSLATVWAVYDFNFDGKPSHCGVDAVQLLRTSSGWKIVSLADTYETARCPAREPPVAGR